MAICKTDPPIPCKLARVSLPTICPLSTSTVRQRLLSLAPHISSACSTCPILRIKVTEQMEELSCLPAAAYSGNRPGKITIIYN